MRLRSRESKEKGSAAPHVQHASLPSTTSCAEQVWSRDRVHGLLCWPWSSLVLSETRYGWPFCAFTTFSKCKKLTEESESSARTRSLPRRAKTDVAGTPETRPMGMSRARRRDQ
jgi:hypothetical protein